jgi:alanyl-tRNA synthetase
MGLRKPPRADKEQLRLIDIHEFDLSACGGTHVRETGQIGCILLRKTEKVRPGWRVEFVCGQRAVNTARKDFTTLTEAAALFSAHIWDVPEQVRKSLEEVRTTRKSAEHLLEETAEFQAARLLADTTQRDGRKIVVQVFAGRDLAFIRLLAQKLTKLEPNVVALLGSKAEQTSLVFAQSKGMPFDMGAALKHVLAKLGGRGGGSKDWAQGGAHVAEGLESVMSEAALTLSA